MDDNKKRYILEFLEKENIPEEQQPILKEKACTTDNIIKKSLNINVNAFFPSSMKKKLNEVNNNKTAQELSNLTANNIENNQKNIKLIAPDILTFYNNSSAQSSLNEFYPRSYLVESIYKII